MSLAPFKNFLSFGVSTQIYRILKKKNIQQHLQIKKEKSIFYKEKPFLLNQSNRRSILKSIRQIFGIDQFLEEIRLFSRQKGPFDCVVDGYNAIFSDQLLPKNNLSPENTEKHITTKLKNCLNYFHDKNFKPLILFYKSTFILSYLEAIKYSEDFHDNLLVVEMKNEDLYICSAAILLNVPLITNDKFKKEKNFVFSDHFREWCRFNCYRFSVEDFNLFKLKQFEKTVLKRRLLKGEDSDDLNEFWLSSWNGYSYLFRLKEN
ncbi:hypothetical protein MHBO_004042 [Bonamia ostreae]|uniref:RNase NYN domain-containing protein n=1 Tax=Bonamia ostreae TaxID=126728 RepID=A0ABV2AS84_9EUKA